MFLRRAFTFMVCLLLMLPALAEDRGLQLKKMRTEQRVALVIGNNAYKTMQPLENPVNDARAIRASLEKRGFQVIYKENATKRDMKKLVGQFAKTISRGGIGMYFFAGHGISVQGRNFLAGIDAVLNEEDDVEFEALALDYVVSKMKNAGNRLNIIALDACRNNPFGRSGGGGLAPIGNAKGLFVAYATEAGSVASDNKNGTNGLFTKHLLTAMQSPGADLATVFKTTRKAVYEESDGKQSPGVYDQTLGEFYFTLPVAGAGVAKVQQNVSQAPPRWLTSLVDYPFCSLGVGRSSAQNPKQEALLTGLMELGFMKKAILSSMLKQYVETDGKGVVDSQNTVVIRVIGETYGQKVSEKGSWLSPNGDYFALVCADDQGIKITPSASMIKFYAEQTNHPTTSRESIVNVVMKDYLNFESFNKINDDTFNPGKNSPKWVFDDFSGLKQENVVVGRAKINGGRFLDAYLMAVMHGRNALAQLMKVKVNNMIRQYADTPAPNTASQSNTDPANTTKSITQETLVGSRVLKLWHDKEDNNLYVLLALDNESINKFANGAAK